jgi:hypothetical protein
MGRCAVENIEEQKPYFATIDGIKKGPFSAKELSDIFQNGGFKNILLDKNENVNHYKERQVPTILNPEFYTEKTISPEIILKLTEQGWTVEEIARSCKMSAADVQTLLELEQDFIKEHPALK